MLEPDLLAAVRQIEKRLDDLVHIVKTMAHDLQRRSG